MNFVLTSLKKMKSNKSDSVLFRNKEKWSDPATVKSCAETTCGFTDDEHLKEVCTDVFTLRSLL